MPAANLTRSEAEARATTVDVGDYAVTLDLTGGAQTFSSETVVRFTATPGTSTFIEATTREVHEIVLNGHRLDLSASDGARIRLDGLAVENVLRVTGTFA